MKSRYLILSLIALPLIAASCNKQANTDQQTPAATTAVNTQATTNDQAMQEEKAMKAKEHEDAMMKGKDYVGVVLKGGIVYGVTSGKELIKISANTIKRVFQRDVIIIKMNVDILFFLFVYKIKLGVFDGDLVYFKTN